MENKNIPRTNMSLFGRFVTYYGLGGSFKKLKKIIKKHSFGKIGHDETQVLK